MTVPFSYSFVCLTKDPLPIRKRVLHGARSIASSSDFQYRLFSLRSLVEYTVLLAINTQTNINIICLTVDWLSLQHKRRCSKGKGKRKVKAIPLQAWTGPAGSRKLRLSEFKTFDICRW